MTKVSSICSYCDVPYKRGSFKRAWNYECVNSDCPKFKAQKVARAGLYHDKELARLTGQEDKFRSSV